MTARLRTMQTRVLLRRWRHIGATGIFRADDTTGLRAAINAASADGDRLMKSTAWSRRKHSAA